MSLMPASKRRPAAPEWAGNATTLRTRQVLMFIVVAAVLGAAAPAVAGPHVAAGVGEPPTIPPASVAPPDAAGAAEVVEIGTSVEGRPITVTRRGDPDGWRVLVIGVIHGDEAAGLDIVARLSERPVPAGVELYLMDSMNPDGTAADVRQNANGVDLNRNFPYNWGPIGEPGNWEYAGPSAASEPETRAVVEFITERQPDLVIWYHQDAYMIAPADGREGSIRSRYAELTALPMDSVSGGTYTGVAATWARQQLSANEPQPGVAFIVELGGTLPPADADRHADAVLTVAAENR